MSIVGENIKRRREALGLSQAELARRMHKTTTFICPYEAGTRTPRESTLREIATALETTPEMLNGDRDARIRGSLNMIAYFSVDIARHIKELEEIGAFESEQEEYSIMLEKTYDLLKATREMQRKHDQRVNPQYAKFMEELRHLLLKE